MNYAWANPTTGIREQDDSADSARLRVWKELQAVEGAHIGCRCSVYEQQAIGEVSVNASHQKENPLWQEFAFASPANAGRIIVSEWDETVSCIQAILRGYSLSGPVVVYAQRLAFTVHHGDPEPTPPPERQQDTPESLLAEYARGEALDTATVTAVALLWIAQAARGFLSFFMESMKEQPILAPDEMEALERENAENLVHRIVEDNAKLTRREESDEDRRARLVRERNAAGPRQVDPKEPHVYSFRTVETVNSFKFDGDDCLICGKPLTDLIHSRA